MPAFRYSGKTAPGSVRRGVLEAGDRAAALAKLADDGCFPTVLEEIHPAPGGRSEALSARELGAFTRGLADLLDAGLALPQALKTVERQAASPRLAGITADLRGRVEGGMSLAAALSAQGRLFSDVYIGMVVAGETGAHLSDALTRLADMAEQEEELVARIKTALAYPLLVLATGGATVLFLVLYVVPKLAGVFEDMGQSLPLVTRLLVALSRGARSGAGLFALVGGLLAVGLFWRAGRVDWARLGRWLARGPWVRDLARDAGLARFTRTLSVLLAGGIPLLEALRAAADVGGDAALRGQVDEARRRVAQGQGLADGFAAAGFPAEVVHRVAVGEEGRRLVPALEKVAAVLERRRDRSLKVFVALLEPTLILAVGGVIAAVVLGMLLPIFQLSSFIG